MLVNWRPKLGAKEPYMVDDIVHHEDWWLRGTRGRMRDGEHRGIYENRLPRMTLVEQQPEREPLIDPPILTKSALNEQPILRRIWATAYKAINEAEHIVFVGYSLPITDIAASYLF